MTRRTLSKGCLLEDNDPSPPRLADQTASGDSSPYLGTQSPCSPTDGEQKKAKVVTRNVNFSPDIHAPGM